MANRQGTMEADLSSNISQVWQVLTGLDPYLWRKDAHHIEVLDEGAVWREYYTPSDYTECCITQKEFQKSFGFHKESEKFSGDFLATLRENLDGGTHVTFCETMQMKSPLMQAMSYLVFNLQAMQFGYMQNLKQALGEK